MNDEDDDEYQEGELVELSFAFYDPEVDDKATIGRLLQDYLDGVEGPELAEIIANQVVVGSIIKGEDQKEVLGFITAINMHVHAEQKCVQVIRAKLLACCKKDKRAHAELSALFENKSEPLGLIVSRRILNVPNELVPPLHDALVQDVQWAQENEITQELQDQYKFKNYLMIASLFRNGEKKSVQASKKKGKRRKKNSEGEEAEMDFLRFEEAAYAEHASLAFEIDRSVASTNEGRGKLTLARRGLLIAHDKLQRVNEEIVNMQNQSLMARIAANSL